MSQLSTMEQLINENPQKLRSMLRKGNNLFKPIIKCVSVNEDMHVVRLLVGGNVLCAVRTICGIHATLPFAMR